MEFLYMKSRLQKSAARPSHNMLINLMLVCEYVCVYKKKKKIATSLRFRKIVMKTQNFK